MVCLEFWRTPVYGIRTHTHIPTFMKDAYTHRFIRCIHLARVRLFYSCDGFILWLKVVLYSYSGFIITFVGKTADFVMLRHSLMIVWSFPLLAGSLFILSASLLIYSGRLDVADLRRLSIHLFICSAFMVLDF